MDLVVQPSDFILNLGGNWEASIPSNGDYVEELDVKETSSIYVEGRYDTGYLDDRGCTYEVVFEVFFKHPAPEDSTVNLSLRLNGDTTKARVDKTAINQWMELPGLRFRASRGGIAFFSLKAKRVGGLILRPVKIRPAGAATPPLPPVVREDPRNVKPYDEETTMLLSPWRDLAIAPGTRLWKVVNPKSEGGKTFDAVQLVEDSMVSIRGWIDMEKLKAGCMYEAVIEVFMEDLDSVGGTLRYYGVHSSYIPGNKWVELDSLTFEGGGSQKKEFEFPSAKLIQGLTLGGVRVRPVKEKGSEELQLRLSDMIFGSTGRYLYPWMALSKVRDGELVDVVELINAPGFLVWAEISMWKLIPDASYQVFLNIFRKDASRAGWNSPLEFSLLLPDQSPKIKQVQLIDIPVDRWTELVVVDSFDVRSSSKITSSIGIAMRDTGKELKRGLVMEGFLIRKRT